MQFAVELPLIPTLHRQRFQSVRQVLSTSSTAHFSTPTFWQKYQRTLAVGVTILCLIGLLASTTPVFDNVKQLVFSSTAESIAVFPDVDEPIEVVPDSQPEYLPPLDSSLPEGNWVSIPRIGVFTQLQATQDPEEALDSGVWQVPDFGEPGDAGIDPIILAAHRFGWDWWWKTDYWKYHSFYNLPTTEVGDRVEVIYNQRKWVYEIYKVEEGELITDYEADLILYTCKHIRSPIRHFRYAKLVQV